MNINHTPAPNTWKCCTLPVPARCTRYFHSSLEFLALAAKGMRSVLLLHAVLMEEEEAAEELSRAPNTPEDRVKKRSEVVLVP